MDVLSFPRRTFELRFVRVQQEQEMEKGSNGVSRRKMNGAHTAA